MTVRRFKNEICFVVLFFFCANTSIGQAVVDSSFHNYLYDNRTAYFNQLPVSKKSIIFFGDSITHWGDWAELLGFPRVLNRGIAGDNSFGLKARLDEVIRHQPDKLFILIGTNDISLKIPDRYIVNNYAEIIHLVKKYSPHTKIYMQSVLPINNQLINRDYYFGNNEQIQELNLKLFALANKMKVTYVDVYTQLLSSNKDELEAKYSYDGLHLSGLGYSAWVNYLKVKKFL
jgi:lysophospholipase L1-like esterase